MRRFYRLFLLVVVIFGSGCAHGVDNGAGESDEVRQLRMARSALFSGINEQTRIDGAVELLLRQEKGSRSILLEALGSQDNPGASRAVCMALIKGRAWGKSIRNRKDFMPALFKLLTEGDQGQVKLAAEALLIFDYKEVGGRLGKIARGEETGDRNIRFNAIEALKLWADKAAISELVKLLDDDDKEVASAAESVLNEWVPVFSDRAEWKARLRDLQRKKASEIVRDRMVVQEAEIRRLKAARDQWRQLCLAEMDKEYSRTDETERGRILTERLGHELVDVCLWALDKVSQRSASTVLPENFDEVLMSLVSDEDRQVRLETARVLYHMAKRNPGEKLLAQIKVEEYEDVRLAIFDALGEACNFAFSEGTKIELDVSVRDETLKFASEYVISDNELKVRKGAEVIGKLLRLNGLDSRVLDKYFLILSSRYERAVEDSQQIAGTILMEMAKLCGQESKSRVHAIKFFEKAFAEGLKSNDASIREASVAGLSNIDSKKAFAQFITLGLEADASAAVRRSVVELAAEVGGQEELVWLAERSEMNGNEGQVAWQAMEDILARQKASVVVEWAGKIGVNNESRQRTLLEMAEKKAEGEGQSVFLWTVRVWLVDVYLKEGNTEKVIEIVGKRLREKKDVGADDAIITKVDVFLRSADENVRKPLLAGFKAIDIEGEHPNWTGLLKGWGAL